MRGGESLVPMTADLLKRIFDESQPDFSAEVCRDATLDDLDPRAVEMFRSRWAARTRREDLAELDARQLLADADLYLPSKGITYAALILFATERAAARLLGQAELIFEYRSDAVSIPYQQREEFRRGFLLFQDDFWDLINGRNEVHSLREGMFRRDLPAFNEDAVREAILNAVCHRDYRLYGPTFVRQSPRRLEVVSPGGFPPDVNRRTSSSGNPRATGGSPKPSPAAASSSARGRGRIACSRPLSKRESCPPISAPALLRASAWS